MGICAMLSILCRPYAHVLMTVPTFAMGSSKLLKQMFCYLPSCSRIWMHSQGHKFDHTDSLGHATHFSYEAVLKPGMVLLNNESDILHVQVCNCLILTT